MHARVVFLGVALVGQGHGDGDHSAHVLVEQLEARAYAVAPQAECRFLVGKRLVDGGDATVYEAEEAPILEDRNVRRRSLVSRIDLGLKPIANVGAAQFERADQPIVADRFGF